MAAKTKAGKKTYKALAKKRQHRRGPGGNSTVSRSHRMVHNGKPGTGRPHADITAPDVFNLSKLQCTIEEIASFFGVHPSTLWRRMEAVPEIREAFEQGKHYGRVSLRRLQFAGAARGGPGSAALLIWLGKQYLGQTDKVIGANVDAKDWATAVKDALRTSEEAEKPAEAPDHYSF